jgi:hypothetical protein
MSHLKKRQALARQAREGQPFTRVPVPRVTCERCGQHGILALPDGSPRPHLRSAVQGDLGWSEIVPVRVGCGEG